MKKMASMQVYMASDPASRQALDRQMVTWDENLEKLHIEQYQLRCYLAALQGADLASTKVPQIHLFTTDRSPKLAFYVYLFGYCRILFVPPTRKVCSIGALSAAVICPSLSLYNGIAEFAGLENDGLQNDGVEQEETYILHTMKWTQTNVYDT